MAEKGKVTYASALSDESLHRNYEEALAAVPKILGGSHPLYIGGKEVFSSTTFEVKSPLDTGISIGRFQNAAKEQVNAAIAAAREGFSSWSRTSWQHRVIVLRKCAEVLDGRKFQLAALITYEVGKIRSEAVAEVEEAIDMIRYYCDCYEQENGYVRQMEPGEPGQECRSVLRPYGVFAVISPFNFPVSLAAGMAGAALLTGNTVVFKPTSEAPYSGLVLYRALREGGIPENALQFLTGPGKDFGSVIVAHPDIAGIAFTGSRDAGTWLHRMFTATQAFGKPMVAELGSKNPAIVTASADIAKAAEGVVRSAFGYSGQKCSAASRVYVQAEVMGVFLDELKERTGKLAVGDPRERGTGLGPVIDTTAVAKFRAAVADARKDGGTVVTGGTVLSGGIFDRGYYAAPTIITGLPQSHRLVQDELFVPVLLVSPFATLEEAVRLANRTQYGLTAGIFSGQQKEIEYFFENIEFGVCYANRSAGATTGAWPGSQPFGGWKGSGLSGKGVGGPYYLLSFVREQAQTRVR